MQIDREQRRLTPEDVLYMRREGCSRSELAEYAGVDVSVIRGMEKQALARILVDNRGIPVEQGECDEAAN